jgi:hypothetical protein
MNILSLSAGGVRTGSAKHDGQTFSNILYIFQLYWEDAYSDRWPMQSDTKFWDAVAGAVNKACNSTRTG